MKIVAISDIHGVDIIHLIPKCDILLIAGDISPAKISHDFYTQKAWFESTFINQLKSLRNNADHIVFIAGNHDTYLYETYVSKCNDNIKKLLPNNVFYLCDESVTISDITVYGIPWCSLPSWGKKGPPVWNFAEHDSVLAEKVYTKIPNNTNIILTHGPMFGFCDVILDEAVNNSNLQMWNTTPDHLGSKTFKTQIRKLLENNSVLKYIISGHIHSADRSFQEYSGVKCACASVLDEYYNLSANNMPLIINYNESEKA